MVTVTLKNTLTRYQKIAIGLFLLVALGIRIHAALQDNSLADRGDAWGYNQIAMSLALGEGYRFLAGDGEPTAWRPPLYPLFLSGIYRVAGHSLRAVRIAQALISTITVLLIARWAGLLFGGWSACLAAGIASVYPAFYAFYFSCSSIGTETLYVLLFTAALYTLYDYWIRPSWSLAVISGLFWGLGNLTRPLLLPFLLLLPLILIPLRYPLRQVLRYCGIVWFVVGLVAAPWTIRNYRVFHAFIPLCTGGGPNLYGAYHPNNWDGIGANVWSEIFIPEERQLRSLGMSEAETEKYFFRKGIGFIRDYPGHAARLFLRRILLYMDPRTTLNREGSRRQIVTWGYLFVLAGAAASFFLGLRHKKYRREILSLCLIFGYFLLFHGFMGSSERYRFPTEPILIVLASFALSFLPLFDRQNSKVAVESKA